jgi:deoxycytidylate deaminase
MSEHTHILPHEVSELTDDMIQCYQFQDRCSFCMMAILMTLIAKVTYHSIEESTRDTYLNDILKNARTMIAGMELRFEHNDVRN